MPYSKLSDANVKELDGVKLTLAQANKIARMADSIGGEYGWPTAIKNFKRSHNIKGGKWVRNKQYKDVNIQEIIIEKEDGRYKIVGVSTAAVKDREDEIFTTEAIDYDIAMAENTGTYPEFRLLHKKFLAVGQVEKMSRVGIFAIDEGYAYDDPFSQEVCDKILKDNDGRWRMSRGFYVLEASGGCPSCGEGLLVETKHMVAGFSCPTCKSIHPGYKGTLNDVEFHKTRTFDVTITDKPCVPMTGVSAFRVSTDKEVIMTKKELRKKLVDAGLSPEKVDERLKEVDAEQLKALDTLPQARLLKELELDDEASDGDGDGDIGDEELFVLDPEVLKDFAVVVKEQLTEEIKPIIEQAVKEAIDGLEIDLGDVQLEGIEGIEELTNEVVELKEVVEVLAQSDEERLQQMLEDSPRAGKLRILRAKGGGKKKKPTDEEDEEEEDEEEEEYVEEKDIREGIIVGQDGRVAANMTEFLTGGE